MKTLTQALLITTALAGATVAGELSASERAALPAPSASLEAQRAAGVSRAELDAKERASLDAAHASTPELAQQSGGGLSDHDLTVIAVTVLIVIAIVIIF
jgi:hypothetical protein